MNRILKMLYYINGKIFTPDELRGPSKRILHISDTPFPVFSSIIKFVSKLKPDIVVHTGDLVDDIKLEMCPKQAGKYKKLADSLLQSLSSCVGDRMIIVPGNHDKPDILSIPNNVSILHEGSILEINGLTFGLAHKFENLPEGCDYYLYGHDLSPGENEYYLNGIYKINIIDIDKLKILKLPYPAGTDNYRLKRIKIGF